MDGFHIGHPLYGKHGHLYNIEFAFPIMWWWWCYCSVLLHITLPLLLAAPRGLLVPGSSSRCINAYHIFLTTVLKKPSKTIE